MARDRRMRFALRMKTKDGEEVAVRDLVALKEYFDPASVLEIFQNGKLSVWLRSHHCDAEAEAVEALTQDDAEALPKLCRIFGRDDLLDAAKELVRKRMEARRKEEEQANATQWVKDAYEAEDAESWDTALKLFEMAADAGNIEAIRETGYYYYLGEGGVEKDSQKAYELWKTAAEQNDGKAYFGLGSLYHYGDGVEKDLDQAESLYQNALKTVDEYFTCLTLERLGDIKLEQGDWDAAMAWYEKTVQCMKQNDVPLKKQEAVAWLAADYLSGKSPKNEKLGWELLNAYSDGDPDQYGVKLRDIADRLMGDFDENSNWDKTIPLYWIAANAGDGDAYWALGVAYQNEYGGHLRPDAVFDLYNKGAGADSPLAMNQLAYCYMSGYGVAENVNLAIKWQHKAIDQLRKNRADVPAYMFTNLGAYYMGRNAGMGADRRKAEEYLRKAADLGDEDAAQLLAENFNGEVPPASTDESSAVPVTQEELGQAFEKAMGSRQAFMDHAVELLDGFGWGNAATAAAAGAAAGSVIPGIGTITGGILAAVVGGVAGGLSGLSDDEKRSVRNYAGNWYTTMKQEFVNIVSEHDGFNEQGCVALAKVLKDSLDDETVKEQVKSRTGVGNAETFVKRALAPWLK